MDLAKLGLNGQKVIKAGCLLGQGGHWDEKRVLEGWQQGGARIMKKSNKVHNVWAGLSGDTCGATLWLIIIARAG